MSFSLITPTTPDTHTPSAIQTPSAILTPMPPFYRHSDVTVPHGFFSAQGGVSSGLYESLNCGFGSDDDLALIALNQTRAAASLDIAPEDLMAVFQVHGTDCVTATPQFPPRPTDPNHPLMSQHRDALIRADGIVTSTPGLALGILTADCLPVLFADEAAGIIGACHAGWRGACGGITSTTIASMRALGATAITALIGPTIAKASYQVDVKMRAIVFEMTGDALPDDSTDACFTADDIGPDNPDGDKFHFDLPAYVHARLHAFGGDDIVAIHDCALDTYETNESPQFFSHRRATHAGDSDSGRQISIIALPK